MAEFKIPEWLREMMSKTSPDEVAKSILEVQSVPDSTFIKLQEYWDTYAGPKNS